MFYLLIPIHFMRIYLIAYFLWVCLLMISLVRDSELSERRKGSIIFLAFCFFLGLLYGVFSFSRLEESFFSQMSGGSYSTVSIIDFLSGTLLPFLFSVFAVTISQPWLLYIICFWEAFLFSYVSLIFLFSFQSFGFAIKSILLFGDCLTLPVLLCYCIRVLRENCNQHISCALLFLSTGLLIGCVDFYLFIPN